jgi:hypothetical protein
LLLLVFPISLQRQRQKQFLSLLVTGQLVKIS